MTRTGQLWGRRSEPGEAPAAHPRRPSIGGGLAESRARTQKVFRDFTRSGGRTAIARLVERKTGSDAPGAPRAP
jgi:hypothetical protein